MHIKFEKRDWLSNVKSCELDLDVSINNNACVDKIDSTMINGKRLRVGLYYFTVYTLILYRTNKHLLSRPSSNLLHQALFFISILWFICRWFWILPVSLFFFLFTFLVLFFSLLLITLLDLTTQKYIYSWRSPL